LAVVRLFLLPRGRPAPALRPLGSLISPPVFEKPHREQSISAEIKPDTICPSVLALL
jgi:hypothetical protein